MFHRRLWHVVAVPGVLTFVGAVAVTSYMGGLTLGTNDVIARIDVLHAGFILTPAVVLGLISMSSAVLCTVFPFAVRAAWARSDLILSVITGIMLLGCVLWSFFSTYQFIKINLAALAFDRPPMGFEVEFAAFMTIVSSFGPFAFWGHQPRDVQYLRPKDTKNLREVLTVRECTLDSASPRSFDAKAPAQTARRPRRASKTVVQMKPDAAHFETDPAQPTVNSTPRNARVLRSVATAAPAPPSCPLPPTRPSSVRRHHGHFLNREIAAHAKLAVDSAPQDALSDGSRYAGHVAKQQSVHSHVSRNNTSGGSASADIKAASLVDDATHEIAPPSGQTYPWNPVPFNRSKLQCQNRRRRRTAWTTDCSLSSRGFRILARLRVSTQSMIMNLLANARAFLTYFRVVCSVVTSALLSTDEPQVADGDGENGRHAHSWGNFGRTDHQDVHELHERPHYVPMSGERLRPSCLKSVTRDHSRSAGIR